MSQLTVHVLDVASGHPAAGLRVEVFAKDARVASATTADSGRTPEPLLSGANFPAGVYRLVFHVGEYFAQRGLADADPALRFIDRVSVEIGVRADGGDYHLPLLASPWSYSVYRGS